MPKYQVRCSLHFDETYVVEAEDECEAMELACELFGEDFGIDAIDADADCEELQNNQEGNTP